ncbi:MAG: hypothetical protein J6W89_00985 [Paludibacteraceae bacterium]|nr:hypothetical protein [Paludibacteraceae bacterium]
MKRILLYGLLLAAMSMQAQEMLPYPTDTVDGKVYYRYTVEKSIGLYRISKNFGVSQEDILKANPELRTRGLVFEEVIRIPANLPTTAKVREVVRPVLRNPEVQQTAAVEVAQEVVEPQQVIAEPEAVVIPETPVDSVIPVDSIVADTQPTIEYTDTLRLAYLLPLQAETTPRNPTIDRFYDFYAGSLLALKHHEVSWTDSLGKVHTTYYDVRTYDVGKYGSQVTQLIDSGAFVRTDAIVGPAYQKPVEVLSAYAAEHQIPVMIPFLQMLPKEVSKNPYLMKFNPSDQIQTHALMEYLDTMRTQVNIVLVDAYADKLDYSQGIRILRDSIKSRGFSTTSTTIRQILADSVSTSLKDSVENLLLFHSERYSNIQLLMPYLLSGKRGKTLTLLSQYAWQGERILLPQLFTGVFCTPKGEALERYEQDFKQYFGHSLSSTQPRYDLLGYDLTGYMLEAMRTGSFHALDTLYEGIQSSMLFTDIEDGGYENTHIVIERR